MTDPSVTAIFLTYCRYRRGRFVPQAEICKGLLLAVSCPPPVAALGRRWLVELRPPWLRLMKGSTCTYLSAYVNSAPSIGRCRIHRDPYYCASQIWRSTCPSLKGQITCLRSLAPRRAHAQQLTQLGFAHQLTGTNHAPHAHQPAARSSAPTAHSTPPLPHR